MWKAVIELNTETVFAWLFSVTVTTESKEIFNYTVTVKKKYYAELTKKSIPPRLLVERTFFFLAEREPFTAILPEFDLEEVQSFFPEFERTVL